MIPAHISAVGDTEYATTLSRDGDSVQTVEHLLSALHAAGITNLLVKVHGEIPVLDGSAVEFCQRLEEIGIVDQDVPRREIVIDRRYEIASGDKLLVIEPADVLSVSYRLRYPPPIGEQFYDFTLSSFEAFQEQIAPARTFGFLRDLPMINELGLGSGGRLDNFILVGEDNVINTGAALPRRVRPPQDPRRHRRPLPARLPGARQGHGPTLRPPRQHRPAAGHRRRGGLARAPGWRRGTRESRFPARLGQPRHTGSVISSTAGWRDVPRRAR